MYKKASQIQLRIPTTRGLLTVEQLWSLKMADLKTLIISLKDNLKKDVDADLAFLDKEETAEDMVNKLRFDIAVDIYKTKKKEMEESAEAASKRVQRQKLAEIIARKKEADLENKSVEELEAMMNEL